MAIEAAFESRCPWCDLQINEGEWIDKAEENGEYMHEECAEEAKRA